MTENQLAEIPTNELNKGKILVCEDEEHIKSLLVAALHRKGYQVEAVESAKDAIHMLNSQLFDLLITDVGLLDLDLSILLDRVESSVSSKKILFMSGYSLDVLTQKGVAVDGENFIKKPFSLGELEKRIQGLLS